MKITIDETVLDKHGLTIEEFMILYLNAKDINISECTNSLVDKGFADKNLFESGKVVVSGNVKDLLATITIDSDKSVIDKDEEFNELARELQNIYPTGRKEGTNYMWRGTVAEVAKKLKTLIVKYNYSFTKEQAIKATKEYVDSFNRDYKKMRLLKYFILKSERDADNNINVISEFMSLIENAGQESITKKDWEATLV